MTIQDIERFKSELGGEQAQNVAAASHLAQQFHRLLRDVEKDLHWHDMTVAQSGALRGARSSEVEMLNHMRPSVSDPNWWAAFVRSGTSGANRLIYVLERSAG